MSNVSISMRDARLTAVPEPFPLPIGLRLAQASRAVERAFDAALAGAGGSLRSGSSSST